MDEFIQIRSGEFSGELRDGDYKVYYPNGNVSSEGRFLNGDQEGEQVVPKKVPTSGKKRPMFDQYWGQRWPQNPIF